MASKSGRVGAYTQPWHGLDADWMQRGTCNTRLLTVDEKRAFFADTERGVKARMEELRAKKMCWACPVASACLEYAIVADMRGIWGGYNRKERNDIVEERLRLRLSS